MSLKIKDIKVKGYERVVQAQRAESLTE